MSSPSLAVAQKAEVRHTNAATSKGSVSESCRWTFLRYSTVIAALFFHVEDLGAMFFAPLVIVSSSGPPAVQGTP